MTGNNIGGLTIGQLEIELREREIEKQGRLRLYDPSIPQETFEPPKPQLSPEEEGHRMVLEIVENSPTPLPVLYTGQSSSSNEMELSYLKMKLTEVTKKVGKIGKRYKAIKEDYKRLKTLEENGELTQPEPYVRSGIELERQSLEDLQSVKFISESYRNNGRL